MLLPSYLSNLVPTQHLPQAQTWWEQLPQSVQTEIEQFYLDVDPLEPLLSKARKVLKRDTKYLMHYEATEEANLTFPNQDYYEYLINHEVYLEVRGRSAHICRVHPSLRAYLILGFLPSTFVCPLQQSECVMTHQVHLTIKASLVRLQLSPLA